MGASRRLAIPDDCLNCRLRCEGDFCSMPNDRLSRLNAAGHLTLYPGSVDLLAEGTVPPGVYIICSGRIKLSVRARDGKTIILKVAGGRHVLGLSSVVSGRTSPVTATTVETCQIKFVEQEEFLELLAQDCDAAITCAQLLADEVGTAFDDVHELLLARSSTEKLARLLLSWVSEEPRNRDLRVNQDFTHEEMAQMIGSSRETVTRLLCDLRRKDLIRLEGSTLVIPNRVALQAIAA
jgi:CRP/FNR family transcriptional regulator, cyclic AMP receptor protein